MKDSNLRSSAPKADGLNQTFPISVFGGDEWIRATDLLRMKEMHYRCATSPKTLVPHDRIELPSPDYKSGVLPFN